jgi:hypothetical protein
MRAECVRGCRDAHAYNGNVVQWETISGDITRETVCDSLKIMPRGTSHLEVHTILINNITIKEVMKWGRDEMGGDFSQDVIKNGWAETNFLGCKWIISIKRDLIPDDTHGYSLFAVTFPNIHRASSLHKRLSLAL